MSKDKEKMTKEEKIEKAKELINDLSALELSDEEMECVSGGANMAFLGKNSNISHRKQRVIQILRTGIENE